MDRNAPHTESPEQDASASVTAGQPQEQFIVQESVGIDEVTYPSGIRLWMAVASCCTVSLLHGLDLTIVAAAVPSLTNYFQTVADIGWYSSAYALMTASFSFLFGKLYGRSNRMSRFYASPVLGRSGICNNALATDTWCSESYALLETKFPRQSR